MGDLLLALSDQDRGDEDIGILTGETKQEGTKQG